jgi:anti-anti-sigma regulatory factor
MFVSVTLEKREDQCVLRFQGECTVTTAGEVKQTLLEGLAAGGDLRIDLQHAHEIDMAVLQLLWAAEREASRKGRQFRSEVPAALARSARDAGFERFPGSGGEE